MPRRLLINPWTPEADELLKKLVRQGKDIKQIARAMRRSPSAVRLRQLKLRSETTGQPSRVLFGRLEEETVIATAAAPKKAAI